MVDRYHKSIQKASTGETIPQGNILKKFFMYVERVSGQRNFRRFLWQSTILNLFQGLPTVFASLLRAKVYKTILGSIGEGCLIEKDVRLIIPSNVFLGERTFLGEFSYLDPDSSKNKIVLKNDVHISRGCVLRMSAECKGDLTIEDHVHISQNSYINANGGVWIGKNCLFGSNVSIISSNHNYKDPNTSIRLQGTTEREVIIEEDVWLGINSSVMPGVTIGKGAVIGAGAVVTKNIPPYVIAVGIPAKIVGKRE